MGMDVVGRNPSAEAGEYFRANVWSWRPIHDLIVQLCSDLLDEETLVGIGYNDGAGPADQTTCSGMANRFERWMEHHVNSPQWLFTREIVLVHGTLVRYLLPAPFDPRPAIPHTGSGEPKCSRTSAAAAPGDAKQRPKRQHRFSGTSIM